ININTGGTTPLETVVTNRGTAVADSVIVTILLAGGGTTWPVASTNIGALSAGASATVAMTFTAPMASGTYTVTATAATSSPEANTANNTALATLQVASSPTTVSATSSQTATTTSSALSTLSTCNYYASPNGTGDGLSSSTPFQISRFWAVAAP